MGKELEKVQTKKVTLFIHGKEREIKFGFSAWAKLEQEYGGIDKLDKMEKDILERPFTVIPHLLFIGLMDKEGVTEENILDDYGIADVPFVTGKFNEALYGSLPANSKKAVKEAKK